MNANGIKVPALEADIQFTALIGVWLQPDPEHHENMFMKMAHHPHTLFPPPLEMTVISSRKAPLISIRHLIFQVFFSQY